MIETLLIFGFMAGGAYLIQNQKQQAPAATGDTVTDITEQANTWPQKLNRGTVLGIAQQMVNQYGLNADPMMIVAMADIESNFDRFAYRYESRIFDGKSDASYGLMQSLWRVNASWLYSDMGYRAFPLNRPEDLYDPLTSIYFGAAFIDWIQRTYGGDEEQIVRIYNGGYGGRNSAGASTHYAKYALARAIADNTFFA